MYCVCLIISQASLSKQRNLEIEGCHTIRVEGHSHPCQEGLNFLRDSKPIQKVVQSGSATLDGSSRRIAKSAMYDYPL